MIVPIRPANFADVSTSLPLKAFTLRHTGSIVNVERFPLEDDVDAPAPLVIGVNVPFNGNEFGGGMGMQAPLMHRTDPATGSVSSLSMSRSTERPPEGNRWIADAGTSPVTNVASRSGSGGGGFVGTGGGNGPL